MRFGAIGFERGCAMPDGPLRYRLGRGRRLRGQRVFAAVYGARCRKSAGPITVYGRPNGLTHARLGLSVPKRVGTAVRRNRIKRLMREAFRLSQHELPAGYDLVVTVRPHEFLSMVEYQGMIRRCVGSIELEWRRRARRGTGGRTGGEGGKHGG